MRGIKFAEADEVVNLCFYTAAGWQLIYACHCMGNSRASLPDGVVSVAEKFMYQFIRALFATMAFKQQFREVDVLMIDDIQFIAGKDSTQ